jgi:biotin transport system substrate-specific component
MMNVATTHALESKSYRLLKDGLLVISCSILLGLCSKISIPLFFSPVPITVQNFCILFLSLLLGSKKGFATVFCLLVQTAIGFPVLSSGAVGIAAFFGPTGGYLIGYLMASYVTGYLVEKEGKRTLFAAGFAMVVGNGIIYLLGAGYLSTFVGIKSAFLLGIAPFLVGDLIKFFIVLKALHLSSWDKSSCR